MNPSALGGTSGHVVLHGQGPGATLLGPKHGTDKQEAQVQVVRLDDQKESTSPGPISLLKVDCEGSENGVMSGARKLLATDEPVLLIALHHMA